MYIADEPTINTSSPAFPQRRREQPRQRDDDLRPAQGICLVLALWAVAVVAYVVVRRLLGL